MSALKVFFYIQKDDLNIINNWGVVKKEKTQKCKKKLYILIIIIEKRRNVHAKSDFALGYMFLPFPASFPHEICTRCNNNSPGLSLPLSFSLVYSPNNSIAFFFALFFYYFYLLYYQTERIVNFKRGNESKENRMHKRGKYFNNARTRNGFGWVFRLFYLYNA